MNKKLIVVLILIIVIAGGAWAYIATRPNASAPGGTADSSGSGGNSDRENESTEPVAATEITYTNNGFTPASLTAKKGATIKIINQSSTPLEFSSDDHPTHTKHPEFNMDTIPAGGEGTLEIKTIGTWGYHNHLKSGDTGMITVTE